MIKPSLVFVSILWLFALAIILTIYTAWWLYPALIDPLEIVATSQLPKEVILDNYQNLLSYLTKPWETSLVLPDFVASQSGLKHFADVKRLFSLVQGLVLGLPLILFVPNRSLSDFFTSYQKPFLVAAMLPILLAGMGIVVGFDSFFTFFHHLLFPFDSSWLFHPQTDPVILILPQTFFLICFLIFFAYYQLVMWLAYLSSRWLVKTD